MTEMRDLLQIVRALTEADTPPGIAGRLRAATFYHGTPSETAGRSILVHGLQPGNRGVAARGKLTPTAGRTYLTRDLRYGIIYTIGGDVLGGSAESAQYLIEKAGRYGYLFAVPGDRLLGDIQPDEDSVGEAVMYAACLTADDTAVPPYYAKNRLFQNLARADPWRLRQFIAAAQRAMTPRQFKDSVFGLYSAWASGGKRFLKVMDDATKRWLLDMGTHAAFSGAVEPTQAWRFDKRRVTELTEDGSNFFELAERVR